MRPDDHRDSRREGQGGIPDGLLVGMLAFLLGMTVLVWTATGLAAWFAQGAWPDGVTFTRTPLAMRHLIGKPHDVPGAWPDTPPAQLSGWGLFWGLFIGQLMILVVAAVFAMGTTARWRANRATRRATGTPGRKPHPGPPQQPTQPARPTQPAQQAQAAQATQPAQQQPHYGGPEHRYGGPEQRHDDPGPGNGVPVPGPLGPPALRTEPQPQPQPQPRYDMPGPRTEPEPRYGMPEPRYDVPEPRTEPGLSPSQSPSPSPSPLPLPTPAMPLQETVPQAPAAAARADGGPAPAWERESDGVRRTVLYAPPAARRATAAQAIQDAPGPTLVVTSDPELWAETKDAKAKLGPILLYDPVHLCDTPARLHWSPTAGCADRQTALRRATALLAPVQPTAKIDQTVAETAVTLLRSYLHAAALENRTVRHVHRWAQGTQIQDAVRTLRTHPKAAPGAAGELEAALTAHPERRDIAQELTGRALSALSTVNIRESCTPNRNDALALDSFVHEGGTLYVVGEPIEDPRSRPGAMPLLTALVSSVVERGRHMAERSSSGRLDPPLTLVMDDIAAVAPFPELPGLLATGAGQGLPTLALLRSREQARARWPHQELPV
ncbi:type VI secretion protein [Streptomyces sp. SID486]|uniref:type IV secretory system conjugative DNA transfer family protein n=1 Tax=Streptomyces sp. SID486 TaxID=2690264 RepID=UPI00136BE8FA|nr:type VI secretion protein [Streptomyces sp. SID486]